MAIEVDHHEVQDLCARGARLVEALPEEEYRAAHLPGAISGPLARLAEVAARFDRGDPVITYCHDYACDLGSRAAARLESLGFREVFHYAPGKMGWQAMGLPVEGDEQRRTIGELARTVPLAGLEETVRSLRDRVDDVCVVVDDDAVVLGMIRRERLDEAADDAKAADVMKAAPSTFRPHVDVEEILQYAREHDLRRMLVTRADGTLIGLLDTADILTGVPS